METLVANFSNVGVHRERLNGREYIVAPITMIVPGVLPGSRGALFYPEEEVANSVPKWNNIILTDGHLPEGVNGNDPAIRRKYGIGLIKNSRFENRKLRGDGWFDVANTKRINISIYNALVNKQKIEVSTGLNVDFKNISGVWNGRYYERIVHNYRPDHFAILIGDRGACSLVDGCGVHNKMTIVTNTWSDAARKAAELARKAHEATKATSAAVDSKAYAFNLRAAEHLEAGRFSAAMHAHSRAAKYHTDAAKESAAGTNEFNPDKHQASLHRKAAKAHSLVASHIDKMFGVNNGGPGSGPRPGQKHLNEAEQALQKYAHKSTNRANYASQKAERLPTAVMHQRAGDSHEHAAKQHRIAGNYEESRAHTSKANYHYEAASKAPHKIGGYDEIPIAGLPKKVNNMFDQDLEDDDYDLDIEHDDDVDNVWSDAARKAAAAKRRKHGKYPEFLIGKRVKTKNGNEGQIVGVTKLGRLYLNMDDGSVLDSVDPNTVKVWKDKKGDRGRVSNEEVDNAWSEEARLASAVKRKMNAHGAAAGKAIQGKYIGSKSIRQVNHLRGGKSIETVSHFHEFEHDEPEKVVTKLQDHISQYREFSGAHPSVKISTRGYKMSARDKAGEFHHFHLKQSKHVKNNSVNRAEGKPITKVDNAWSDTARAAAKLARYRGYSHAAQMTSNGGLAYVIHGTIQGIKAGKHPNDAFAESAENENYYGDREDIRRDREKAAAAIKQHLGIAINPHHKIGSKTTHKKKVDNEHISFDAMVAKLKEEGHDEESAKAIAATIGRKKYGKKRFQKAAAEGKPVTKVKNSRDGVSSLNNSHSLERNNNMLSEQDRDALIKGIVLNCDCYSEEDREVLNELDDRILQSIHNGIDANKKLKDTEQALEKAVKNAEKKPINLADLPAEVQTVLNYGQQYVAQRKAELIGTLVGNLPEAEREAEAKVLNSESIESLERMAKYLPKKVENEYMPTAPSFLGMGAGRGVNNAADLQPAGGTLGIPTIDWSQN